MAAVQHARGVQLLVKVESADSPGVYAAYCTINAARGISFSAATRDFAIPDCTDPDLIAWVAREKESLSVTVTGAGILNTPDVDAFFTWWSSATTKNVQIVVDVTGANGGVVFEGAFHLTDFEITGDRGAKMEATLTLQSDGEVTADPNA